MYCKKCGAALPSRGFICKSCGMMMDVNQIKEQKNFFPCELQLGHEVNLVCP